MICCIVLLSSIPGHILIWQSYPNIFIPYPGNIHGNIHGNNPGNNHVIIMCHDILFVRCVLQDIRSMCYLAVGLSHRHDCCDPGSDDVWK